MLMDHSLVPEEYYLKDNHGRRLDWLYAPTPRPGGFDRSWASRMHWIQGRKRGGSDPKPGPVRTRTRTTRSLFLSTGSADSGRSGFGSYRFILLTGAGRVRAVLLTGAARVRVLWN